MSGEKEIWKSIEGYDGLYEVSNWGRIRSVSTRVWIQTKNGGYYRRNLGRPIRTSRGCITLYKNGYSFGTTIAQIVARAFIQNPLDYPCVLHINGDIKDNNVKNLKWGFIDEKYNKKTGRERSVKNIELNKIYPSIKMAAQSINRHFVSLQQCLSGKTKTSGGFHWEYVEN